MQRPNPNINNFTTTIFLKVHTIHVNPKNLRPSSSYLNHCTAESVGENTQYLVLSTTLLLMFCH